MKYLLLVPVTKSISIAILLVLLPTSIDAQTFYQVTHLSGSQTLNGNSVAVTSLGGSGPVYSCTVGPFQVGNSSSASGYLYQFSKPIDRIRLRFVAFHPTESYVVFANGTQYLITSSEISAANPCGTPNGPLPTVTTTGIVINSNSTASNADSRHQLDLLFPTPMDSVRVQRLPAISSCVFDFRFCNDTVARITKPFIDTVKCPADSIHIAYTVNHPFLSGNTFTLQLSNASGSFSTPVNIGMLNATGSGTIPGKLPMVSPGNGYRIRIISSNPYRISDDNGVNLTVVTTKGNVLATNNGPICENATLSFTAVTSLQNALFTWTGPGSYATFTQHPSISNAMPGHSGDYIVTASANGCSVKDTVTVLVKPKPVIPAASSNSPVCSGNSLNLTASSTTSGVAYDWTGPLSYTSTTQNPMIANTTTSMSGTYNVTATLNGCTSAAGTTNITVNLTPATPTATSNTPVCAGGILNLSANSATPGVNYSWTGPNGFASTAQNPIISPVPLNAGGTYDVTAELNGCTSTGAGSTTVVVNNVSSLGVYPSPNDTLCVNNTNASFVAVPFNAGTAPQYQWFKNNNVVGGATNITYPATGIADGDSFYCRMTVTGLCADPLVLYSNKVGMTVLPLTTGPSVSITADPGTLLSPWQLVKFTAVATNAGAIPKYQWKRNSQDVIGANSNVWSANNLSNGDTISCVVTSDVWCANPANAMSNRMVVNIKLGITDIDKDGGLKLYPNPNNGSFIIDIPRAFILRSHKASLAPFKGGIAKIDIVNALGQTVYESTTSVSKSTFEVALSATIANGVYMLKLHADGIVYHARFTVSR
jgi:hypothetical protein